MKKILGILGGMGPLATADLFRKIVNLTDAACDGDHIRILIDSNTDIPDRTAAILAGGKDPVPAMYEALRNLEQAGADCLVMPCNTAHYFLPRLRTMTALPFLSMPEATAKACAAQFPGKTAAILATKGTLSTGLYQEVLAAHAVPCLVPGAHEQDALMRIIYQGIKANRETSFYREDMVRVLRTLSMEGADYFILGCTELPLAIQRLNLSIPMVDPTAELAKAAIRYCGYPVKE